MSLIKLETHKSFGGIVKYYQHYSELCNSTMTFSVFLPPQTAHTQVPAIFWLSGLTCNHENFITKAGAQKYASQLGVALIMPDTSPRNLNNLAAEAGYGAGFYVNATVDPLNKYFNMYDYILQELPKVCEKELPILSNCYSIMGHSMGGHGALILALRNPGMYRSVSAFAPICNPTQCEWGHKYFTLFLGPDKKNWQNYDSTLLIPELKQQQEILIDQGSEDPFLNSQLMPEQLIKVCRETNYPLNFRYQPGYDHSYFFIASFIEELLRYHASRLMN